MNRQVLFIFFISMMVLNSYSQIQQEGYVKTRAKKNIPSKYIPNAIIKAGGAKNKVKSDSQGRFILVFPKKNEGESFSLESITKKGYELVDFDLIGQPLAFSTTVPLKVLMEPEGTMFAELKKAEEEIEKHVNEKRNNDFASLSNRLKIGDISEDAFIFDSILIENEHRNNMQLVAFMAKKYAQFDYDSKDSIINTVIDNIGKGDLANANQLLFEQTEDYRMCLAAVKKSRPYQDGRVGGPLLLHSSINPNSTDTYIISFVRGVKAHIIVSGDGDTVLELQVWGNSQSQVNLEHTNLLAFDEGDDCVVSFVPPYTGKYFVIVRNKGDIYNWYKIDKVQ